MNGLNSLLKTISMVCRKILFTTLWAFSMMINVVVAQNGIEETEKYAKIVFKETSHNFGQILLNGDGNCEFEFMNEGNAELILTNVKSSCGCTIPSWPKEPVFSGKKSSIKVKYDTSKPGSFNKSIIVYSNGSKYPVVLKIKGKVINKTD